MNYLSYTIYAYLHYAYLFDHTLSYTPSPFSIVRSRRIAVERGAQVLPTSSAAAGYFTAQYPWLILQSLAVQSVYMGLDNIASTG